MSANSSVIASHACNLNLPDLRIGVEPARKPAATRRSPQAGSVIRKANITTQRPEVKLKPVLAVFEM